MVGVQFISLPYAFLHLWLSSICRFSSQTSLELMMSLREGWQIAKSWVLRQFLIWQSLCRQFLCSLESLSKHFCASVIWSLAKLGEQISPTLITLGGDIWQMLLLTMVHLLFWQSCREQPKEHL